MDIQRSIVWKYKTKLALGIFRQIFKLKNENVAYAFSFFYHRVSTVSVFNLMFCSYNFSILVEVMNFFFITSGQVESKGFPVFFPLFLGEGGQVGCKEMSRNYFSYTRAVLQLDQISSATDFYSPFGIGKMKVKSIRWDLCF